MKELIGWRLFYDDGTDISSKDVEWNKAPLDGVLVLVEFYNDGTKQYHQAKDYYLIDDGKALGTNQIDLYLRKTGAVKFGRWVNDKKFYEILLKAKSSSLNW